MAETKLAISTHCYLFFFSKIYQETSKVYTSVTSVSHRETNLRVKRSGDRILVGARFSAPVQTGPGTYPASHTMGTGSFPGVKRPGRGVDHPSPSSAEDKERVELYLCSLYGPSWPVLGWTVPLPLPFCRGNNREDPVCILYLLRPLAGMYNSCEYRSNVWKFL